MHMLVEGNKSKQVEHLVLHNYEIQNAGSLHAKFILPVGTELIIKEPHLQLFGLDPTIEFGIRVDSPSDIIIVSPMCPDKSIDSLIEAANKEFTYSHFFIAVRLYTLAIEKSNQMNLRAYLNRAQCYLKLLKPYAAYKDAKRAIELDPASEKANFRLAKAAYLLGKYVEAKQAFLTCIDLNKENINAQNELIKCNDRLNESKEGEYSWNELYEQILARSDMFMDIADFRSSKIEISDVKNKAKGMLASEDISEGTLLVVSKAATAIFNNEIDSRLRSCNLVKCMARSYNTRHEVESVAKLMDRMTDDPELAKCIYSLYAGPEFSREPPVHSSDNETLIVDVGRIEQIFAFNSFQIRTTLDMIELENYDEKLGCMSTYDEEDFNELDITLIEPRTVEYQQLAEMQVKYSNLDRQCGLWYTISYFNHSCVANCYVNFIGDVIAIHAFKDVKKGEELTIRYFPADWPYPERNERARTAYGFECDCPLCEADKQDPMRLAREKLLESIDEDGEVSITETLANHKKMQCTYLRRPNMQLHLLVSMRAIAEKYRSQGKFKDSILWLNEIYKLAKPYNDYMSIKILKDIYLLLKLEGNEKKAIECRKKAFKYFKALRFGKIYSDKLWIKMIQG